MRAGTYSPRSTTTRAGEIREGAGSAPLIYTLSAGAALLGYAGTDHLHRPALLSSMSIDFGRKNAFPITQGSMLGKRIPFPPVAAFSILIFVVRLAWCV